MSDVRHAGGGGCESLDTRILAVLNAVSRLVGGDLSVRVEPAWRGDVLDTLTVEINRLAQKLADSDAAFRDLEESLFQERLKMARTLRTVTDALTASFDMPDLLARLFDGLAGIVPFDAAAILLLDGGVMRIAAARGFARPDMVLRLRVPLGAWGCFGEIVRTGMPCILSDPSDEPHLAQLQRTEFARSWMGVPLLARNGGVTGILSMYNRRERAYGKAEERVAMTFAEQAVIVIENARIVGEAYRQATTDGLTGVVNRRHFFELAEREIRRPQRSGHPVAALMMDIDNFKLINDTHGHAAGDQVLRAMAARCSKDLRGVDLVGRYGGEEFVFLLPETDTTGAAVVAERLRSRISEEPVVTIAGSINVTASLGVAVSMNGGVDLSTLIHAADSAMYRAKRGGRNRVELWEEGL